MIFRGSPISDSSIWGKRQELGWGFSEDEYQQFLCEDQCKKREAIHNIIYIYIEEYTSIETHIKHLKM